MSLSIVVINLAKSNTVTVTTKAVCTAQIPKKFPPFH